MIDSLFNRSSIFFSKYKYYFLFIFFLLQFLLFKQFIKREILPVYPISHDQVIYLNQSFEFYKAFQHLDFREIYRIIHSLSTGVFLQFFTGIVYVFLGPSREIALYINFSFFILLQIYLFRLSSVIFKSLLSFIFSIGLLLSIPTIYHTTGGIFDFRLDFVAFCLNYVFLSEILILFFDRKKFSPFSLVFFSIILFYSRTNLIIVYSFFFVLLMLMSFFSNKKSEIKTLIICYCITLLFISPFIFISFKNLYRYYVIGHIKGKEVQYRKAESNTSVKIDSVLYYPKSIYDHHVTPKIMTLLAVLGLSFFTLLIFQKRFKNNNNLYYSLPIIYFLSFFIPYTFDQAKSSVIGMNLTIPIVLLLTLFFGTSLSTKKLRIINFTLALLMLIYGLKTYYQYTNSSSELSHDKKFGNVIKLIRDINSKVHDGIITQPTVATFYANELSERLMMYYYAYDYNEFKIYTQVLGNTLGPFLGKVSVDESRNMVIKSNIVLYNVGEWTPDWIPFNQSYKLIRSSNDDLISKFFCQSGDDYELPWGKIRLYIKPSPSIETSGDWLLSNFNISLNKIDKNCLNKFSYLRLSGVNSRKDTKRIQISISYLKNKQMLKNNIGELTLKNDSYDLLVPIKIDDKIPDEITITSEDYLVPSLISDSKDERKLLIFKPDNILLQ